MRVFCWATFLVWTLATAAFGYPPLHGPFPKGEAPASPAVRKCAVLKKEAKPGQETDPYRTGLYADPQEGSSVTVRLRWVGPGDGTYWESTVLDKNGAALCDPTTGDLTLNMSNVFTADLNGDRAPDFMVGLGYHANGLAADRSSITFLLSDKGRYKATSLKSFHFGPEDIVRLKPGGPCYFIQNDLVRSGDDGKNKDGRHRNFWVYRLHRFDGGRMVEANADDARFPKWVWYTYKENHEDTGQLTAEQKKRLLERHRREGWD